MAWAAVSVALVALVALPARAQVVRGRVVESGSALPLAGVLVSLYPEAVDSAVANALSTPGGEYGIRAPGPGRYRLAAKRIGVRRFVTQPFDLGPGETRQADVSLDAIAQALPEVSVPGLCVSRPRDLARVSALWDEARTALEATDISLRDRLFQATISRHAAELDPATLRVRFDWLARASIMVDQPFVSLSGDSLSRLGYWRRINRDSLEFLAPDAAALTSNAFLREHCFSLAAPERGRPDLVGLAFVPARSRTRPDISGTVWLDARSYELRHLAFRYTQLPPIPVADRIGGEVHFARLATGAWIVERWYIRMPHVASQPGLDPEWLVREEGGSVSVGARGAPAGFVAVEGVVQDSGRRPLPGAVVRAVGTARQAVTDGAGRYRLDSLPPGATSIAVHAEGYDALGLLADSRRVELRPGQEGRVDSRAPAARALLDALCPRRLGIRPAAALRLVLVDSATAVPLSDVRFRFTAQRTDVPRDRPGEREVAWERVTDARGAVMLCLAAAPAFPVDVSLVATDGSAVHVMQVPLRAAALATRIVTGRRIR